MADMHLFRIINTQAEIGSIALLPFMDVPGGYHQIVYLPGGIWCPYLYRLFGGEVYRLFSGKALPGDYAPAKKMEKVFADDYGPTKGINGRGSAYKPWTWGNLTIKAIAAGYKGGLLLGDRSRISRVNGKDWIYCSGINVPYLSWSVYTAVHLVTVNRAGTDYFPLDQPKLRGMKFPVLKGGHVLLSWLADQGAA